MSDRVTRVLDKPYRAAATLVVALITGAGLVLVGAGLLDARIARGAEAAHGATVAAHDKQLAEHEVALKAQAKAVQDLRELVLEIRGDVRVIRAELSK